MFCVLLSQALSKDIPAASASDSVGEALRLAESRGSSKTCSFFSTTLQEDYDSILQLLKCQPSEVGDRGKSK